MRKKCELCGNEFTCTKGPGCWCTYVGVSTQRREEIAKAAHDCVCPDCLSDRGGTPAGSQKGRSTAKPMRANGYLTRGREFIP
ncbi:MAG: cysteine-rich CWC family protein [Nitrososphaerota archaeon]|nr:cysteine-rich CWC family protein [Nitrososphaerota archaeon]MDG7024901.1 cysteine-rich CWC family protein [Nitrososphaerota archaeon]